MRETMRDYLRRRYRFALIGVVIGTLLMICAPGSAWTIALEMAGAVVLAIALLIGERTRCPKCRKLFDHRVIAALVRYSHAPPERCPRCGVDLNQPRS
jgi:hypothetical protein